MAYRPDLISGVGPSEEFCSRSLISFLPAAHIADRWSSHYGAMVHGHEVTCCADPRRVMEFVPEVRPTTFGAVPRIWEKTKAALETGFDAEPDEERRTAVRWALEVGLRKVTHVCRECGEHAVVTETMASAGSDPGRTPSRTGIARPGSI